MEGGVRGVAGCGGARGVELNVWVDGLVGGAGGLVLGEGTGVEWGGRFSHYGF